MNNIKRRKKRKQLTNYYRLPLQLLTIALLAYMVIRLFVDSNYVYDFEAYCPFGGMLALSSLLENNTLACSMTEAQIFMGVVLLAGVIVFSKLFCSFICPIGTFTEWLGRIGQKYKVRYTIKGLADHLLRALKYILLFLTFYFTVGSSELFCREWDPFYAIFSGFGHDVKLWFAVPALIAVILGSIFVRQFWCKYLCPLGAATNIFANVIPFAGVVVVYAILVAIGAPINWVWLLAAVAILGFALETIRMKGLVFPLLKITRDPDICTGCIKCDRACPMAIPVSKLDTVEHIDCHLCTDCIESCPEKGALKINKRKMSWLPPAATVGLILLGLYLGTTVELPTINERWGTEEQLANADVYSVSGLKNIKCYGSSASFVTSMKKVEGVYGAKTFVQTHTVEVLYDPNVLSEDQLKAAIFSPTRRLLRNPPAGITETAAVVMGINKLFDAYDSSYLIRLLSQQKGIYGLATEFGEPVRTTIYFDPGTITVDEIRKVIESPLLTYESQGKEITQKLEFGVGYTEETVTTVDILEFKRLMFMPYDLSFNDFETYSPEQLSLYSVYMPQAGNIALRRRLTSLVSHLSWDEGIVRFTTEYTDRPNARITFVKELTDTAKIYSALAQDTLTVQYSGGKSGKIINPFKFPEAGKITE